jgi:hypothetical protein
VDIVRGIQERIAVLEERIQLEKEALRDLLTEKGENWSDTEGYARLLADSVRRTYDIKALDELIITDPLRNGWLKDYRRERKAPCAAAFKLNNIERGERFASFYFPDFRLALTLTFYIRRVNVDRASRAGWQICTTVVAYLKFIRG